MCTWAQTVLLWRFGSITAQSMGYNTLGYNLGTCSSKGTSVNHHTNKLLHKVHLLIFFPVYRVDSNFMVCCPVVKNKNTQAPKKCPLQGLETGSCSLWSISWNYHRWCCFALCAFKYSKSLSTPFRWLFYTLCEEAREHQDDSNQFTVSPNMALILAS